MYIDIGSFYIIGNFFEIAYDIKNAARACKRFCKGRMSQKYDAKVARECTLHILYSTKGFVYIEILEL